MPQSLVTPIGESVFACVLGEARTNTFNDKREYTMGIQWKQEDPKAIALQKTIDDVFEEAFGKKKKPSANGMPYKAQTVKDEMGELQFTGNVEFRFKRNEKNKHGELLGAPKVEDANLRTWPEDKLIGNGSLVRVAYRASAYERSGNCGVYLFLVGVQVLKHVEYDPDANLFSVDQEYAETTSEFEAVGTPSSLNVDATNAQDQIAKAAANLNQEGLPF